MMKNKFLSLILLVLVGTSICFSENYKFLKIESTISTHPANKISIFDKFIYVYQDKQLWVYSINNLCKPQLETAFTSEHTINDIAILDTQHIFVCTSELSNKITEIDSLNRFGRIFTLEHLTADRVTREGVLLFAIDKQKGLEIYNLGKGMIPKLVSVFSLKWGLLDLQARYPIIHALNSYGYVRIDISDLENPQSQIVNYEITQGNKLCLYHEKVYIADGSTLVLLDITKPDTPQILTRYRFAYNINDLKVKNNELYVALDKFGLKILDLTNPYKIKEKNSLPIKDGVKSIEIDNDKLFLAIGRRGWLIVRYD